MEETVMGGVLCTLKLFVSQSPTGFYSNSRGMDSGFLLPQETIHRLKQAHTLSPSCHRPNKTTHFDNIPQVAKNQERSYPWPNLNIG
jgi:hypothetical protein